MKPNRAFSDLSRSAQIAELVAALPPLPRITRYYDDFAEKMHAIRWAETEDVILSLDGSRTRLPLSKLDGGGLIMRHVMADWFSRHDPHTVAIYTQRAIAYATDSDTELFYDLILLPPHEARSLWVSKISPNVTSSTAYALRAMLHALCRLGISGWTPSSSSLVTALSSPKVDKYRVVRAGDCFVPLDQQATIIEYIDGLCDAVSAEPQRVSDTELISACLLVLSYQYAFRPGQIARIEIADVRVFSTGAVHVAVRLVKQKDLSKRIRVTRRIKREWGLLFAELVERRESGELQPKNGVPPRLLFGMTPGDVSIAISRLTDDLTGDSWSPTDLRHTAAQRLADGGISHVGLSEFMGHTSERTANVYFDASPSQAQRINEALAISPIYANIALVAKTKTINKTVLLGLPADRQIGGVPHGVPIAGIGGCGLGQSLCTKSPVLACYGCSRFMPLNEPAVHAEVLEGLRPVVTEFAEASRSRQHSPAYAQLKATLDAVRRIVEELKTDLGQGVSA